MMLKHLFWWVPFGRVPEISAKDLHASMANGKAPVIIDVRTRHEYESSHIKGAVSIPISSLKQDIKTLDFPPDQPVVTICLSAHRSIPAVRLFAMAGFTDVCQLQGGMQSWWHHGLPVAEGT